MSIAEFENTFARVSAKEALAELCKLDVDPDVLSHFVGKLQDDRYLYTLFKDDSTRHEHKEVLFRAMPYPIQARALLRSIRLVHNSPSDERTDLHLMMLDVMSDIPFESIKQLADRNWMFPDITFQFLCCFSSTPPATFEHFLAFASHDMRRKMILDKAVHPVWCCRLVVRPTHVRREY